MTWKHAIERQFVTPQAAYGGLRAHDITALAERGCGGLEVLVRYRSNDFDDRAVLTIAQLEQLPLEQSEIIRDVFAYHTPTAENLQGENERWDVEAHECVQSLCAILAIDLREATSEQVVRIAQSLMDGSARPHLQQRWTSERDREKVLEASFRFVFAMHGSDVAHTS